MFARLPAALPRSAAGFSIRCAGWGEVVAEGHTNPGSLPALPTHAPAIWRTLRRRADRRQWPS